MLSMNSAVARVPITVADVVTARAESLKPLVYVDAKATIAEVVEVLAKNGVVSAPVKDVEADVFIGLVNLLEMFAFAGIFEVDCESYKLSSPVADVLGTFPDALSLWKCDRADSLEKVLLAFRKGIHRVLVFDAAHPSAAPVLISQSDVIKYLNSHPELVPADQSVNGGLGFLANENTDPVVTVAHDVIAATAFKVLADNDMTAAPIVDDEGRIVGTISASDLRGATPEIDLSKPVVDFLVEKHARGAAAPVSVGKDAKIGEILIPLSYAGVHRVWVIDGDKRPVGVVSMSDVIGRVCDPVVA